MLIGSLTMIIQYMQQVSDMFYNVAWQYSASVQNYTNTLAVEDIISKYKSLPETLRLPPLKNRKTIAINELSFTYKDAHKRSHTLQNIDLTLHAGEKIAVVGESGSGKSTFLSLLR
ncbi:ABC transporter ATP-binding protein/permease [Patescibacteria group bacterium]|nr:ABC transporter ATP-binding protein/permease [Patescibacteria group bacterium]